MGNPPDKPKDPSKDDTGEQPRRYKDGVKHDQRGNAVWQWAAESGRHLMESTSALLKRLEVPGLKLEEDATGMHKKAGAPPAASGIDKQGQPRGEPLKIVEPSRETGYDPYGSKKVTPGRPGGTNKPVAAARPTAAPTPKPAVKPSPGAGGATKPAAAPPARQGSLLKRLFGRD